jgi:hypothetical protein
VSLFCRRQIGKHQQLYRWSATLQSLHCPAIASTNSQLQKHVLLWKVLFTLLLPFFYLRALLLLPPAYAYCCSYFWVKVPSIAANSNN